MSTIINLKTALMKPLIRSIIKHPKLMESKLFLKAMQVFPEKISMSYDEKVKGSALDYEAALSGGLGLIKKEPLRILDLCTGTGIGAFMALKRFPEAIVTGVDQSQGMIAAAEGKVPDSDRENQF